MSDPIENAIKTTASNNFNSIKSTAVTSATSVITAVTPQEVTATLDKLKKLPINKDPELIKKQLEANTLKKKAEAEQLVLNTKDTVIETAKEKLKELVLPAIPFPPKLPVIDPKILQAAAVGLQAKELWKQRKNLSKKNLQKGKETYSFPLKPVNLKPELPQIPDLPTLI
jgi:hypothetical protein